MTPEIFLHIMRLRAKRSALDHNMEVNLWGSQIQIKK